MQYLLFEPLLGVASLFTAILIVVTLIMFFISYRTAFRFFVLLAFFQFFVLGSYWLHSFEEAKQRNNFIQPIVSSFNPSIVAEGIELAEMRWNGKTLTYAYAIAQEDLIPDPKAVRRFSCRGSVRVSALALGATLSTEYRMDGKTVTQRSIKLADCFYDD